MTEPNTRTRGTGSSGQLGGTGNDIKPEQPNQGWMEGQGSTIKQEPTQPFKDRNPAFRSTQTSVTDDMRGVNNEEYA